MANRVVVFLDWQNVYKSARETFHPATPGVQLPGVCGQVNPLRLAEYITEQIPHGQLEQVRIYRGRPSSSRNSAGFAASRAHETAWRRLGPKVHVFTRTLQYIPGETPREKGIDVQLALDFAVMACRDEYDIGVIFSADTDLRGALDFVYDHKGRDLPHPRSARWQGSSRRPVDATGERDVPSISVPSTVYHVIKDTTRYSRRP